MNILNSLNLQRSYFQIWSPSEVLGGQEFGGTPFNPYRCKASISIWTLLKEVLV